MTVWVDANVLLRFITKNPIDMAERAKRLLQRGEAGELRLRLHTISLAETVWVLESFYRYEKERISAELGALLATDALEPIEPLATVAALETMARHNADFADALLAEQARAYAQPVATFDGDFERLKIDLFAF
jgi:predicted nucleic acid-binding protein